VVRADGGHVERDDLVADELVDDPSMSITTRFAQSKKRFISVLNSIGRICSASVVDPRTSANSIEISTSAPPGCVRTNVSHTSQ
jgi:hypothetical protein